MLRVSRQGAHWRATDGHRVATGRTRIEALRAFEQNTRANTLEQPRRWVLYVASKDDLLNTFAEAVTKAGRPWKPVVIGPLLLGDALSNLHPDAVVIATPRRTDRDAHRAHHTARGGRSAHFGR